MSTLRQQFIEKLLLHGVLRPQVYSMAELERLFTVGTPHPKHRAFLMTAYDAGLRLNKACHIVGTARVRRRWTG